MAPNNLGGRSGLLSRSGLSCFLKASHKTWRLEGGLWLVCRRACPTRLTCRNRWADPALGCEGAPPQPSWLEGTDTTPGCEGAPPQPSWLEGTDTTLGCEGAPPQLLGNASAEWMLGPSLEEEMSQGFMAMATNPNPAALEPYCALVGFVALWCEGQCCLICQQNAIGVAIGGEGSKRHVMFMKEGHRGHQLGPGSQVKLGSWYVPAVLL